MANLGVCKAQMTKQVNLDSENNRSKRLLVLIQGLPYQTTADRPKVLKDICDLFLAVEDGEDTIRYYNEKGVALARSDPASQQEWDRYCAQVAPQCAQIRQSLDVARRLFQAENIQPQTYAPPLTSPSDNASPQTSNFQVGPQVQQTSQTLQAMGTPSLQTTQTPRQNEVAGQNPATPFQTRQPSSQALPQTTSQTQASSSGLTPGLPQTPFSGTHQPVISQTGPTSEVYLVDDSRHQTPPAQTWPASGPTAGPS